MVQFEFLKPEVIIYSDFLETFPFKDLLNREIPLKEYPKEYLNRSVTYPSDSRMLHVDSKQEKYMDNYRIEDVNRVNEFLTLVRSNRFDIEKPYGEVQCPFSRKTLKYLYHSKYKVSYTTDIVLKWFDGNGELAKLYNGYYSIPVFKLAIEKVDFGNDINNWYSPEVLEVFASEWKVSYPYVGDVPDGTLVEDNLSKGKIAYSKPQPRLEDKLFYISAKGRFYKRASKGQQRVDSPDIAEFENKLKKVLAGEKLTPKHTSKFPTLMVISDLMRENNINLQDIETFVDTNR